MDHARARPPRCGARVLEERQVHPRRAVLVAVEEVVHGGVVLVDGPLDHPQAEHAGVEVDVGGASAVMAVMWWTPSSFIAGDSVPRR